MVLFHRHRFTTDTWNWESPSGTVEPGESPLQAAVLEAEEDTGWRPRALRETAYAQPIAVITNAEQYVFVAEKADYVGPHSDSHESERIEWTPLDEVVDLIRHRRIALEWNRQVDFEPGVVNALLLAELGFVSEQRGDLPSARTRYLASLDLAEKQGDPRVVAQALAGQRTHAAQLLGAAASTRQSAGATAAGRGSTLRYSGVQRAAAELSSVVVTDMPISVDP